jgi:DNA-binding transcriptional MerR regulator
MEAGKYLIDDLCNLTGCSRRNVRYYVKIGLLEAPAGRGRGGFYADSQLERLREIMSLRERGMRLSAIRSSMSGGTLGARGQPVENPPAGEAWVRFPVVPGVEVHMTSEVAQALRARVEDAVQAARTVILEGRS